MEALLSTILHLIFLLLLLPSPSTANESNILITGDILPPNGQLSVLNAALVMQNDCNLVLYHQGSDFQSGTSGRGTNCTLTLSDYGQLTIKNNDGSHIWSSSTPKIVRKGEYAVILQPDGQLGFYGPALWSTPILRSTNAKNTPEAELGSEPPVPNMIFSSDVLSGKLKMASRDYTLEMKQNCSLQLTKASAGVVWGSSSSISGRNCFARLNYHGQLAVVDDDYRVLWETKAADVEGVYALVVKINGQATIYGSRFWSTEPVFDLRD